MRHSVAEPATYGGRDIDRKLSPEGLVLAGRLGSNLPNLNLVPDLVLCSTAQRTRLTCHELTKSAGFTGPSHFIDEFYSGGIHTIIERVSALADSVARPLVIGHNPTVSQFLSSLCSAAIHLDQGSLVELMVDIDVWMELGPNSPARVARFLP